MKVYRPGSRGKQMLIEQPGRNHPISEFMETVGKERRPKQFCIQFIEGVADVSDALGRYLVDKGLASRSPIIVPE